jgi:tetrahydromethanopterin S-methyltransferase subunit D
MLIHDSRARLLIIIRSFLVAAAVCVVAVTASPAASANSCYYPNCTAAHKAGEGDIPKSSPHYCPSQDRDDDGIACEWK